MRSSKEAGARKGEILDIAQELFTTKGYDNTSTADILERAQIARGTLYYHFKSKEEILDALIERIMGVLTQNIKEAVSGSAEPIKKIKAFLGAMKVDSDIGREITEYAHKPQNALMHQKMQECLVNGLSPFVLEIIREGIKEGVFFSEYPEEVVEMLLIYGSVRFDDMNEMTPKQRKKKTEGFVYCIEKLLGVPSGALSEISTYI